MRWWLGLGVLCFVGCSDAVPCSNCPDVTGSYDVTWVDGGSPNPLCPGPRPASWALRYSGTSITTTVGEAAIGGTLYDTYDFVLTGSSAAASLRLRGLVIPDGAAADAGIRLQGTLTTRTLNSQTAETCESIDAYTARRR